MYVCMHTCMYAHHGVWEVKCIAFAIHLNVKTRCTFVNLPVYNMLLIEYPPQSRTVSCQMTWEYIHTHCYTFERENILLEFHPYVHIYIHTCMHTYIHTYCYAFERENTFHIYESASYWVTHPRVELCSVKWHVHTYMHTHTHTYIHTCEILLYIWTCKSTHPYVHIYIHTYILLYIWTWKHLVRIFTHMCIYAYIHVCIHTYIHTYAFERENSQFASYWVTHPWVELCSVKGH
jgi:hypothetical protein